MRLLPMAALEEGVSFPLMGSSSIKITSISCKWGGGGGGGGGGGKHI